MSSKEQQFSTEEEELNFLKKEIATLSWDIIHYTECDKEVRLESKCGVARDDREPPEPPKINWTEFIGGCRNDTESDAEKSELIVYMDASSFDKLQDDIFKELGKKDKEYVKKVYKILKKKKDDMKNKKYNKKR